MVLNKIALSIATNYISDWGMWEMFREFAQNALDAEDPIISFDIEAGSITISNKGELSVTNLLYGGGDKAQDNSKRGMHGEGFKNALLVAVREEVDLRVFTGNVQWKPVMEYNNTFDAESLHIDVSSAGDGDGRVTVMLNGLKKADIDLCMSRYLPRHHVNEAHFGNLEDGYGFYPNENPLLYVGGLFVSEMPKSWWEDKEYVFSYNLPPKSIKLDRDRNSINEYDLQLLIGEILVKNGEIELMADLAYDNALDIQGYSEYTAGNNYTRSKDGITVKSSLSDKALALFYEKHGDKAYPIPEYLKELPQRIELVKTHGFIPIVIPSKLYRMFDENKIKGFGAGEPDKFDPIHFLTGMLKHKNYSLRGKARSQIEIQLDYLKKYGGI